MATANQSNINKDMGQPTVETVIVLLRQPLMATEAQVHLRSLCRFLPRLFSSVALSDYRAHGCHHEPAEL